MSNTMKAMVYYGANEIRFEERPIPKILQPDDAVIKLTKVTICGTDLGIWKGKTRKLNRWQKKKLATLMAGFSVMKALASLKKSVQQSKTLKRMIGSLFPASAAAVPVKIARNSCMHTVVMTVAGLWVI